MTRLPTELTTVSYKTEYPIYSQIQNIMGEQPADGSGSKGWHKQGYIKLLPTH